MSGKLEVAVGEETKFDLVLQANAELYKNKEGIGDPAQLCGPDDRRNGHSGWKLIGGEPREYQFTEHFNLWRHPTVSLRDLDRKFPDKARPKKPRSRSRYHFMGRFSLRAR